MATLILRPNSDNVSGLFKSIGSNEYALIDESVKDEADFVFSYLATNGNVEQKSIYGFPNHTTESGTITSVTVRGYYSGTYINGLRLFVKIGATEYSSDQLNPGGSVELFSKIFILNPATSAAWVWSEIDDILAGHGLGAAYGDDGKGSPISSNVVSYQYWLEVAHEAAELIIGFVPRVMIF